MPSFLRPEPGWQVDYSQDGIDLIGYEENISVSVPAGLRDELFRLLTGRMPCEESASQLDGVISGLRDRGVVAPGAQLRGPAGRGLAGRVPGGGIEAGAGEGTGALLSRIRRHLVGASGPVLRAYRADPAAARFAPRNAHVFISVHSVPEYGPDHSGDGGCRVTNAFGISADPDLAQLKAIMEAVERSTCGVPADLSAADPGGEEPSGATVFASARELGSAAVDPRAIVEYRESQYRGDVPVYPFDPAGRYYWAQCREYPGGAARWVPIDLVYYPVPARLSSRPVTFASSSGVAAGADYHDALMRAAAEAIERDAFVTAWVNRLALPWISEEPLPGDLPDRIDAIRGLGAAVHVMDLTLDLAPVALVIVRAEYPVGLLVGAACAQTLSEAVAKGLDEVEQQLYWATRKNAELPVLTEERQVFSTADHIALYRSPVHHDKAEFLWETGRDLPRSVADGAAVPGSGNLLDRIVSRGYDCLVANLTTPQVAAAGVQVVRVLPVGLSPMYFGYGLEPTPVIYRRLRRSGLGMTARPWPGDQPFLHPFG